MIPHVEHVIDGDTHSVQITTLTPHNLDILAAICRTVYRSHISGRVLEAGNPLTTPARRAELLTSILAALPHEAFTLTLTPAEAYTMAEELDHASIEPDRCARHSCDRYQVSDEGLCDWHHQSARHEQHDPDIGYFSGGGYYLPGGEHDPDL